ncbi:MAG: RDD family protein [Kaiparowitsia implicata GSE-PSE-MK54-09C]|jgi:uncharacterized RDD family membrane protein YckC|nr:RDD family protein [Kaiparowitsia implicata GSE-PSE-MK54-09C]
MRRQLAPIPFPIVPRWRRAAALGIDGLLAGIASTFVGYGFWLQAVMFALVWLVLRVLVVSNNRGQSLGRWAMDIRLIEIRRRITPTLLTLTQREALLGICAFLAFWGALHFSPTAAWTLLLLIPLGVVAASTLSDDNAGVAIHDQYTKTRVVPTDRGYSLDIKIRNLVAELRQRVKK